MELYCTISIVDADKANDLIKIHKDLNISVCITTLARGTAKKAYLDLHELEATEKAVIYAVASKDSLSELIKRAQKKLYIDIPGNGIMMAIPIKSIAGKKTLEYMTNGQKIAGGIPNMKVVNELIIVILNEGHADTVMDAAREAGATGGTVLHAKGTAPKDAQGFFGVSIAEEKDVIYILAPEKKKSDIMKAINEKCGVGTEVGAISFSLPVSEVAGIRRIEE